MAENKAGIGIYSHPNEFKTAIDDPETPAYLSKNDINSTSIRVSWVQSKRYTGPTVYKVMTTDLKTNKVVSIFYTQTGLWFDELATEAIIGNLDAYWNYSIDVKAVTSFCEQDTRYSNTSTIYIRTEEDVPGPVTNLTVRNETDLKKPRQLFVSWEPPTERDLNGIIVGYDIFC
ncbi:hypothetical protein DPMN_053716 [Dreissena polymorpha]|uniref:Fibronectin type-III domain-containing protein n=1 Tax=Dreissena polymorpha TaxID=45954 RepID=A0A9D4CMM0_DREPO|nr:hypothetical protein DPMN_053716 [Dreissena polymorpha]